MNEPIEFRPRAQQPEQDTGSTEQRGPSGVPSNEVYARVGDAVLRTAQDGVRRRLPAKEIIREIVAVHDVRLNVGELRLLLASRRI